MIDQNFESLVKCIKADKNIEQVKEAIRTKISTINQIDYFPVEIQVIVPIDNKYAEFNMDSLYKCLMNTKRVAQLYLNLYNKDTLLYFKRCFVNEVKMNMPFDKYMEKIKDMEVNQIDENLLLEIIAIYVIIHSLILNQEKINAKDEKESCIYCDNPLYNGKCDVCDDTTDYSTKNNPFKKSILFEDDEKAIKNQKLKSMNYKQKSADEEIERKINENIEKIFESNVKENQKTQKEIEKHNPFDNEGNSLKSDKIDKDNSDQSAVKTSNFYSLNEKAVKNSKSKEHLKMEIHKTDKFDSESNKISKAKNVIVSNENLSTLANTKSAVCDNKWTCSQCSYANKTSTFHCITCGVIDRSKGKATQLGTNNLSEPEILIDDGNKWTCSECSYANKSSAFQCEICDHVDMSKGKATQLGKNKLLGTRNITAPTENAPMLDNANIIDDSNCWACNSCSYVNKNSTSVCEVCLNIDRNPRNETEGIPDETWRCNKCGNNNSFEVFRCQNCREIADFVDKWVCDKCSFYNDKLSNRCGACEINNPHLGKCRICFVNVINKQNDDICNACINSPVDNSIHSNSSRSSASCRGSGDTKVNKGRPNNNQKVSNIDVPAVQGSGDSKRNVNVNKGRPNNNQKVSNIDVPAVQGSGDSKRNVNVNQGRPNNNQQVSNIDVPAVQGSGDTKSKKCKKCKNMLNENDRSNWCNKCEKIKWLCPNKACDAINFTKRFCRTCHVEKGSDLSNCKEILIESQGKAVRHFQCGHCLQFVCATLPSCTSCHNPRDSSILIKCECGYNNDTFRINCKNCYKKLKKS